MWKIILCVGLPASWKTSRANEQVKASGWKTKRVNKDDLRAMIDAWQFSKPNESHIIEARNMLVEYRFEEGFDVIVDDTNLNLDHHKYFLGKYGKVVEIKSFLDITPAECIERDSKRENPVGQKVIEGMCKDLKNNMAYFEIQSFFYDPGSDNPEAYIFDIDWTLAIMNNRSPYDWKRVSEDIPNRDVIQMLRNLEDYQIIIFTWRDWSCENETKDWLDEYKISYNEFRIREAWDTRPDWVVKFEMFKEVCDQYNIRGVFDDRQQCIDLWRTIWLTAFQVAPGDF